MMVEGLVLRKVPPDWEHPRFSCGGYVPLCIRTGEEEFPDIPESECTHYQLYYNADFTFPVSPPFERAEELVGWAAENAGERLLFEGIPSDKWLEAMQNTIRKLDGESTVLTFTGKRFQGGRLPSACLGELVAYGQLVSAVAESRGLGDYEMYVERVVEGETGTEVSLMLRPRRE